MSDTTFVSSFSSLSTLSFISSGLEIERFEITNGVSGTVDHIIRQLKRGKFSSGFKIAVFEYEEKEVAVLYVEDWRAQCFPEEVLDKGEEAMEKHRSEVYEERLDQLKSVTAYEDNWNIVVDEYDASDGGGDFGQTQFFAVDPSEY